MKTKTLVPLVGIHSAGKTTIRQQLEKLNYITEEECAEILRVQKKLKAGASADISFESIVKQAEQQRDNERIWNTNIIFVESWHILTLAYMLTRGIHECQLNEYFKYVSMQNNIYSIHCIFLKSSPYKILERSRKLHSEEDISQYYNFYEKLQINIKYVLEKLKLDYREFDTMKPLEITMKEIINYIKTC